MTPDESTHGMWSSRWLFVLAAAGSAVGLGNIWKFPYIAGENGGGVFVVAYLFCVALVGIPVMVAEVLIGRQGRQSPINSMRLLVQQSEGSKAWSLIGWAGVAAGFLILSFYSVIAGWGLYYIGELASGGFTGVDGNTATQALAALHSNPILMAVFHTVFMGITIFIVARGVVSGLERAIRWLMPLLFVLLIVLLGYGMASGGFAEGFDFMFALRWDALSFDGLLVALGHAAFTLSIGMGAIMAYGAYVPSSVSITRTVMTIAMLDTLVALIAGLAIFSIVFANGLEPGSGPGLMFVTVPLAFGQMPLGALFGGIFFILVSFAAITSAISLTEPAIAFLVEEYDASRSRVAVGLGIACWLLGLASVFSFNIWSDVYVVGEKTVFDSIDYLTANIMLPLGALFIALFAGYVLPRVTVMSQLGITSESAMAIWTVALRVVAPLGILAVFLYTIWPSG